MNNKFNKIKLILSNIFSMFRCKNWREIFRIVIFLLLSLVIFSTFSFSYRPLWNKINNLIYAILLISFILYIIIYGKFVFDVFFAILAMFNIAISLSSIINGIFVSENLSLFTVLLLSITAFMLYQYLINDQKNLNHFLLAFACGSVGFLFFYFIIYADVLFSFTLFERLGTYFANQNVVGNNLGIITIFFFYIARYKKEKIAYFISLIGLFFIFSTGSMSSLFSTLLVVALLIFIKIPKNKRYIFWIVLSTFIISFILLIQIPSLNYFKRRLYGIINAFLGIDTGSIDLSTIYRKQVAYQALLMFLRKPLFGFGFSQVQEYASNSFFAHNNIMELLANHGLIGLITFELFLFFPLIGNILKKPKNYILSFSWLLFIIIFQIFSVNYYSKPIYFIIVYSAAQLFNSNNKAFYLNISLTKKGNSFKFR